MALFQTLTDNFDDNSINGTLWYTYGLGVAESSQTFNFTSQTSAQYSGWGTNSTYDLTGSYILLQMTNAGDRTIASLEVQPIQVFADASNALDFFLAGTTIYARKKVAGVTTNLTSETYSSTNHQWLRIRESGGTTYWDRSANGSNWVNMTSAANPITVTSLTNETVVGTYASEASTTTVSFDNFNLPVAGISPSSSQSPSASLSPSSSASASISPSASRSPSASTSPSASRSPSSSASASVSPSASRSPSSSASASTSPSASRSPSASISPSSSSSSSQSPSSSLSPSASASASLSPSASRSPSASTSPSSSQSPSASRSPSSSVSPSAPSTFTWKGYTWERRTWSGAPTYNSQWNPDNVIGPDGNDYVTLRISNPTGTSPYAAEFQSQTSGWGWGTYTVVVGTQLDTLVKEVVFGNMFTYDPDTPVTANEIDAGEYSAWGTAYPVSLTHTYWTNVGGVNTNVNESVYASSDVVTTHQIIWTPSSITIDSYAGTGTGGTRILHNQWFDNLPTPFHEKVHFNIWLTNANSAAPDTVAQTDVVLRDFTFVAQAASTSPSSSPSPSASTSPSSSISPSSSLSASVSPSSSNSSSVSASVSPSASISRSVSPSGSVSPSASPSPSASISPSASPVPNVNIDYLDTQKQADSVRIVSPDADEVRVVQVVNDFRIT